MPFNCWFTELARRVVNRVGVVRPAGVGNEGPEGVDGANLSFHCVGFGAKAWSDQDTTHVGGLFGIGI